MPLFTASGGSDSMERQMDPSEFTARRATVDDLPALKLLWERNHLQILDLEKVMTEFQLMISPEGDLLGAVALHIEQKQGHIHSEAYARAEDRDVYRPVLWQRLENVAKNHGLLNLWIADRDPFWTGQGFAEPNLERLKKLPESFRTAAPERLVLALREEAAEAISLEHEFELFQQNQRASSERIMAQAQKVKNVVYVIVLVAVAAMVVFSVYFFVQSLRR